MNYCGGILFRKYLKKTVMFELSICSLYFIIADNYTFKNYGNEF